MKVLFEPKNLF